jgi:hypothetical protein
VERRGADDSTISAHIFGFPIRTVDARFCTAGHIYVAADLATVRAFDALYGAMGKSLTDPKEKAPAKALGKSLTDEWTALEKRLDDMKRLNQRLQDELRLLRKEARSHREDRADARATLRPAKSDASQPVSIADYKRTRKKRS